MEFFFGLSFYTILVDLHIVDGGSSVQLDTESNVMYKFRHRCVYLRVPLLVSCNHR